MKKFQLGPVVLVLWGCLLGLASNVCLASALTTQSILLQPGWNSIFIELEPDDGDVLTDDDQIPARVFNVPNIEMVWAYPRSSNTVQYFSQPDEIGLNDPDWHVYIPASQPTAALTNLFGVSAGRVYLVKFSGSSPATLVVQGRPHYKRISWKPESFNLVGFYANPAPAQQVSFANFLSISANSNPAIFKLVNGNWQLLTKNDAVEYGIGYWVYNDGSIKQSGPIDIGDIALNGLSFGALNAVKQLKIVNRSNQNLSALMLDANGYPLRVFDGFSSGGNTVPQWNPVSNVVADVVKGKDKSFLFSVDQTQPDADLNGILTMTAGGMRLQLALNAATVVQGDDGLWIGTAVLNGVSNVNAVDPLATEAVATEMTLKLILHSGPDGVFLLKQVYLLGDFTDETTAQTVLVTRDESLPNYTPLALARGENVGYRISSSAFDFSGDKLALSGNLETGLTGLVSLPPDLPTHPMLHQWHPDHDNRRNDNFASIPASVPGENRSPFAEEVWEVDRQLSLIPDQHLDPSPDAGLGRIFGVYQETIHGMHKRDIVVKGRFTLQRVSLIDGLAP